VKLSIIAARSENGVIGHGSKIPWKAEGEQKLFKDITMGGVLIMGRKTYQSIGKPLPGRETIVISRTQKQFPDSIELRNCLPDALNSAAKTGKPIFVAGGGEIYSQTIEIADYLHLTTVHTYAEGNIRFPSIPVTFSLRQEDFYKSNINYTYQYYERDQ